MERQLSDPVVAVFESQAQAQRAVQELRKNGFTESEIGVASRQSTEPGTAVPGTVMPATDDAAASGATTGVVAGLGAGALWGIGIAAGLLPAIGPVIAGGTLAAIAASAATGAAAGGLAGTLIGAGVSEADATYYENEFNRGRVVVTVWAKGRRAEAERIMEAHHGLARSSV